MPSDSPPRHRALLLPGLDGTGLLFRPFTDVRPPQFRADVLSYPETLDAYDDAVEFVASRLPDDARVLLVAESFSGPAAISVAVRHEQRVCGVVLVASFARSPVPSVALAVPWRIVFCVRPPALALRRALLGMDCEASMVSQMQSVLAQLPGRVLARRVRSVLTVDVSEQLRACRVPMLYICGRDDLLVGPRALAVILGIRPDLPHVTLDAPHLVLQRAPTPAWHAIERFAERL
jgi:pimeloyl-[acyl-carrier protein] methyl ester esterase